MENATEDFEIDFGNMSDDEMQAFTAGAMLVDNANDKQMGDLCSHVAVLAGVIDAAKLERSNPEACIRALELFVNDARRILGMEPRKIP